MGAFFWVWVWAEGKENSIEPLSNWLENGNWVSHAEQEYMDLKQLKADDPARYHQYIAAYRKHHLKQKRYREHGVYNRRLLPVLESLLYETVALKEKDCG